MSVNTKTSYRLAELAEQFNLQLSGDGNAVVEGLATLQDAGSSQLSFIANPNYAKYLANTNAAAVIMSESMAAQFQGSSLIAENPYLAFARITALFDTAPSYSAGIHPSAVVDPKATLDPSATVAAGAVVEAGAVIAADAYIGANTVIGADSSIGAATQLKAGVTIAHGCSVGASCIIHSGAVIGADGFGFAPEANAKGQRTWVKIYQLGAVVVADSVEIGANTTIDRGALDDTVIGEGVKIDNQCQIAHNVTIGDNTAIAAGTAIAGSTRIGRNCTVAGCVGIVGHIDIADDVHVTAMSMVSKSIAKAGSYSSSMPMMDTASWRKNAVRIRQLDKMARRLQDIEKSL